MAVRRKEFIVRMIDEFQFMNAMIYWDRRKKNPAKNLAGGYLSTAESKIAPLLVSGSWVGWLMNQLKSMPPTRFYYEYLENMPENEAVEMVYKFSRYFDVPVTQGPTHFDYRGVQDNIFDKVFRGVYEKEIRDFDVRMIRKEYSEELQKLKKQYDSLLGKYNNQKGLFAEYLILEQLRLHGKDKNALLNSITRNLPGDFNFCDYTRVWKYNNSPEYAKSFSLDIFAHAQSPGDYSIIGEVKSREVKKFSKEEAMEFETKFSEVKKLENIERAVGFIFSRGGFTKDAEAYCREKGIACSEDERWLDPGKFK